MMQSAILQGERTETLLVPHRVTIFFTCDGKAKLMARHRAMLSRSPPMSQFNAFIGAKYSFHIFDQVYSNTRVPTQVNKNQRESSTSQHESVKLS